MNESANIIAEANRGSTATRRAWRRAIGIALAYALVGALWVPGSDWLLRQWVDDLELLTLLQTWKGWFFTAISALVLLLVLVRMFRKDALREHAAVRQRNDLRALSQFQDGVIDNASIWINVLDAKARVIVWNKAAEALSGFSREDVLGRSDVWVRLYPDEVRRSEVAAKINAILRKGLEVEGYQTIIRSKDGSLRNMAWNARRFFLDDGEMGTIVIGQDVTEREQMQEELEWIAAHDALTGLYNRRHFERLARARLADCARDGQSFALLWIDIDNFKSVNDRFGHRVGDSVLREIGGLTADVARGVGLATRYGGDELVLALPDKDLDAAMAIAENLRKRVETASFLSAHAKASGPTLSIGVAVGDAAQHTLDALLVLADHAMYRAKSAGRNRVAGEPGSGGFADLH
ncbi:MAG: sensor domain-containing diguanylate cyclase [Dokdonella sp.]|nr:MAG: sensor domain-containing diguanylate cyclase [Gammaproteobacteria bacterium]TXI72031.1 MAG: sensor domain-containing diguanylate cyclase [Dokdonella sp.]